MAAVYRSNNVTYSLKRGYVKLLSLLKIPQQLPHLLPSMSGDRCSATWFKSDGWLAWLSAATAATRPGLCTASSSSSVASRGCSRPHTSAAAAAAEGLLHTVAQQSSNSGHQARAVHSKQLLLSCLTRLQPPTHICSSSSRRSFTYS
jgi:hypothetical protein